MYLKTVNIRNFRTIASLDLQLRPGLNVVFGPNEAGKSTFLEALHAAFFVNADSAKTDVNQYRPWESQADPSVKVVFDAGGKEFEIEKVFVGAKKGRLTSKATGLDTSNKDRINEELAKLIPLYSSDGRSLRNTFWIVQGELESTAAKLPDDSNLRSALQRIMFRTDGNLEEIKKSIKKTIAEYKKGLEHLAKNLGPVAQAKKDVESLSVEVNEFRTQLESFERNITQQKELTDRVSKLQAHIMEDGDVLQAFDKYRLAKKSLDDANAALDALQEEFDSYQSGERRIDEINKHIGARQGEQEKSAASLALLQKTEERNGIVARANEDHLLLEAVRKLEQQLAALDTEQTQFTTVTKNDLEKTRSILNDIEVKRESLKASQLNVETTGLSNVRIGISEDGKAPHDESLNARESKTFRANQKLRITIPTVVELTITSGESNAEAIQKQLNDAEQLLSVILGSHGVKTFEELSKRFDAQQHLSSSIALLETEKKAKLNGRSMENLEQSTAALTEKERFLSKEIGDFVPKHGESVESLQQKNSQLVEELAHLNAEVKQLEQAKGKFLAKYGAPDQASGKRKELAREAAKAEAALEGIPKMELEDDKIFTLKKNLDTNKIEYARNRDELLKISGAVQSSSVSSDQLHLKEAELSDAQARYESNLIEYEAFKILDETLAEAEANVSTHLMRPIEEHVRPMLPQLTASRYSGISLNEGLEIESVGYKNLEVKPDDLSTGTQGQIALALRLALIKHLSGNDRQLVVVDDALVNFDAERLKEGKKLLTEIARTQQVIYLTCHTELKKWSDAEVVELS